MKPQEQKSQGNKTGFARDAITNSTETKKMQTTESVILPVQKLPEHATRGVELATTQTQKSANVPAKEKTNGTQQTDSMFGTRYASGTTKPNTPNESSNLPAVSETVRSTDFTQHLESLREESSDSMNLIDSTNAHLHELMKDLQEQQKQRNPERADPYRNKEMIQQTVSLASQLHRNLKLKVDTLKMLHKIASDLKFKE